MPFSKPLAYLVGKLVVHLHYTRKLDLYSLPSIHAPELWAKSQRKAKIPQKIRWAVWRRDDFRCLYCGIWGDKLSLDHVVPETYGGSSEMENLITACGNCNAKKGSTSFDAFINSKYLAKKRRQCGLTTTPQQVAGLKAEILSSIGVNLSKPHRVSKINDPGP